MATREVQATLGLGDFSTSIRLDVLELSLDNLPAFLLYSVGTYSRTSRFLWKGGRIEYYFSNHKKWKDSNSSNPSKQVLPRHAQPVP